MCVRVAWEARRVRFSPHLQLGRPLSALIQFIDGAERIKNLVYLAAPIQSIGLCALAPTHCANAQMNAD
jgi:hypothetical protein